MRVGEKEMINAPCIVRSGLYAGRAAGRTRSPGFAIRSWLAGLLLLASWPLMAAEMELSPMLTLRMGEQRIELERAQLDALPQHRVETTTAWTDGRKVLEGPLVRDVLGQLGLTADSPRTVQLVAWDGYTVEVESTDFYTWDVILARRMDGETLTLEDRGPLWVVYPRDQHRELQDSRFDHRWVWMLSSLVVNP